MTSRTLVKPGGAATAGFALLALACGDGRAPSGPAPGALPDAAAHLQAIDRAITTPTLRSFAAATAQLPSLGASALAPAAALVHAARPRALEPPYARAARQAEELRGTLPLLDSLKARSIFPPGVIGKTFVWDATLGSYRPSNRRGAPPNGVRLVLYAIDPLTRLPSSPLTEIGYADLIDESRGDAATLRVVVVDTTGPSPATVADYTISGQCYLFSATLAATGYFTDRATRVDFDMSLEASPLKSTFRSTFDLSPQSARVTFNATFVPASANSVAVAVDYRITTGARNVAASGPLTVTRTPDGDSLSGTITVRIDGRGFATITFGGTGPTFQGPAGRPLTADELELLEQLYTVPQDILEAFENAVKPLELWFRTGERVAGLRG